IDNMDDIEQPNVSSSICLSDTEPGPNENFDSDDFFTRQPKKRKNLSITTEQKKKKKVFSKSIIRTENLSNESTTRHDNDYITNEHNNHITNNDIANEHNCDYITSNMPESSSNTNQPPKPNLKDLQLVPIDKVLRKSWIWSYYQLYQPVQPYKWIVRCLFKINGINGFQQITEESHKQQLEQQQFKQINIDAMFAINDPKRKARRNQKFISMLVKDHLPINIREEPGFIEFLAEFDPNYQYP
ncbi:29762_t:CDS:2, partial [Racocetra persica]